MGIVVFNVVVAVLGILISFPMEACVKRFCQDEKIWEKNFKNDMKFSPKMILCISFAWIALLYLYGISEKFFIYAFLSVILIIDLFVDLKAQIIPNGLNMVGFIVGIIYMYVKLVFQIYEGIDLLLGVFVGGGIFLLIALFALIVYRKEGMGLGDVKLMGVLGLFLGARNIFQIFIISFTIGAIVSIILLIARIKKMDDYIPFGPFIVVSTFITMVIPYTVILPWIEKMLY